MKCYVYETRTCACCVGNGLTWFFFLDDPWCLKKDMKVVPWGTCPDFVPLAGESSAEVAEGDDPAGGTLPNAISIDGIARLFRLLPDYLQLRAVRVADDVNALLRLARQIERRTAKR